MILTLSDGSAVISQLGQSMYSFYGLQVDKTNPVFSTTAQAASATSANSSGYLTTSAGTPYQAGDIHYVDQNTDGVNLR